MADYTAIKNLITDVVKTNGAQEITGANLQNVLVSMINAVASSNNEDFGRINGSILNLSNYVDTENEDIRNEIQELANRLDTENEDIRNEIQELANRLDTNRYGYNVTVFGLVAGVHTLATAVKNVPPAERFGGQKITFKTDAGWVTYQNTALSADNYEDVVNWVLDSGVNVEGDVTITNNPDYEDLTQNNQNELKFADKEYSAATFSGLGRIYLRKNIVSNKNVLTQAMLADENTIYIIQYDYDLNGENIIIPAGCVLQFRGGHISDILGTGNITLNGTYIDADDKEIGILNCAVAGTYSNPIVFPEWLVSSSSDDFTDSIQSLINCAGNGAEIVFSGDEYEITPEITMGSNITFSSNTGSTIFTNETGFYRCFFRNIDFCENITFYGLSFEQRATTGYTLESGQVGRLIIGSFNTHNILIDNCKFLFNGTNCISVNGVNCKNTIITNSVFVFRRVSNIANYDVSHIYVADHFHQITNNRIYGYGNNYADRAGGGIESHGFSGIVTGNNISNVKVGVNVVNDIIPSDTDSTVRQVSNNVCDDVDTFVVLWPSSSGGILKNVSISDNLVTNIKLSALTSTYSTGVDEEVINVSVRNNVFVGLYNNFDGNDYNPYLPDMVNHVAIKLLTPNNVKDFVVIDNVFRNFPGSILQTGYYNSSVATNITQQVKFINNTLEGCFNGTISYFYNNFIDLALFKVGNYGDVEIYKNTINIPDTTTMPPYLIRTSGVGSVVFKDNMFTDVVTQMTFIDGSTSADIDIIKERTIPQIFADKTPSTLFIIGDYVNVYSKIEKCSRGGRIKNVTMPTGVIKLSYGVGYYEFDNNDGLENSDNFTVTFGNSPTNMQETITCICGNRIYTERWRTVGAYFEEGVTQYTVSPSYLPAYFSSSSIDVAGVGPTNMERGMSYYSTGLNRPIWKGSSGWLDAFGHASASFSGTWADRPINASYGHLYAVFDSGQRRLIVKNSASGDSWIYPDGRNGAYRYKGTTTERPSPTSADSGFYYYDTDLKKMILWNGTSWVNLDGTALS